MSPWGHKAMHGEIITIGNELVSGRTVDLNAWYAAGRLTASGLKVTRITTVGDDPDRMSKALNEAISCSRFVIITGGLGSTEDDITCRTVADALNRPLCLDEKMFRQIKVYVKARGIELSPALEKMAWMPEGSRILNPDGNFCGFSLSEDRVRLYFLPGVPEQMRFLMDKFVIPEILSQYETLPVLRQRILKLYGINEPRIADTLKELLAEKQGRGEVVLYCPEEFCLTMTDFHEGALCYYDSLGIGHQTSSAEYLRMLDGFGNRRKSRITD